MLLRVDAKTRPNTNVRSKLSRGVLRDSHRRLEKKDPREDAVQHEKRGPASRAADGWRARPAPSGRRFGRVSARIIVADSRYEGVLREWAERVLRGEREEVVGLDWREGR